MKLLHKIIFGSHLIADVIAGAVTFFMSATGVIPHVRAISLSSTPSATSAMSCRQSALPG